MRKTLVFLLILSFLMPSVHFIAHEHNYNPVTKKLEHIDKNIKVADDIFSSLYSLDENLLNFREDACSVKIINEVGQFDFKVELTKSLKNKNNYSTVRTYNKKIYKFNTLLLAPKNSPPLV